MADSRYRKVEKVKGNEKDALTLAIQALRERGDWEDADRDDPIRAAIGEAFHRLADALEERMEG